MNEGMIKARAPFFNRRVEIAMREIGVDALEARAAIEDDYHHFRVLLRSGGGVITEARSHALRFPNNFCPAAGTRLAELPGKPLVASAAEVMEFTDARQQCTHQFDLAALAVAALAHRRPHRLYEVSVPDRIDGRTSGAVRRDGVEVLRWALNGHVIQAPALFAGRSIGTGFTAFVRTLPEGEAEAALVLRRAVFVSQGRGIDIKALGPMGPLGGCWAWQPERAGQVERIPESRLDFSDRPEALVADDQDWLAFAG